MFMHLRLESFTKAMAPKIFASRHLGSSPTMQAVKRPVLGFKSAAGSVVKDSKHGVTSQ
jgi:hypothetical protein